MIRHGDYAHTDELIHFCNICRNNRAIWDEGLAVMKKAADMISSEYCSHITNIGINECGADAKGCYAQFIYKFLAKAAEMDKAIKSYLSKIGRKGGKARTPEKQIASRLNGKKGGRPVKPKQS